MAIGDWGSRVASGQRTEGEGRGLASSASGFSPPSSPSYKRQKERICKSLDSKKKSLAGLLPPLGRFVKRIRKKGE
jgi:hypothetical protein